ncbi:membrane transport protein, hypothetical [Vibrio furnissii NCTC 11218]|nr:membrane transport protein, hypothetical [Vibrio furnissii NCTC 11218]
MLYYPFHINPLNVVAISSFFHRLRSARNQICKIERTC